MTDRNSTMTDQVNISWCIKHKYSITKVWGYFNIEIILGSTYIVIFNTLWFILNFSYAFGPLRSHTLDLRKHILLAFVQSHFLRRTRVCRSKCCTFETRFCPLLVTILFTSRHVNLLSYSVHKFPFKLTYNRNG